MQLKKILYLILFTAIACVPPTQFKETQNENKRFNDENDLLTGQNERLTVENTELKSKMDRNEANNKKFISESEKCREDYDKLDKEYDQLSKNYDDLKKAQQSLLAGSESETRKLLAQLQSTQADLQKREDELYTLSKSVDEKKRNLDELKAELDARNKKLVELEHILNSKDSAVNTLRQKVSAALLGFENQGLTITQKNGKVYVSLDEKLLFKSGSTEVDVKGVTALKKLAKVLEQNPDINIMIEGHTDDVPVIGGSSFKDNWDLSVQRATSIVRILLDGTKINPKRLTAAGRSEYYPIDPAKTPVARQKNRRTEIILTPKLDELFKVLDSN